MPAETEPAATEAPRRGRVSPRVLVVLALVALGVYGLDQLTKYLVVTHLTQGVLVPLLGPVLGLYYVTNSGAAFSLASGFTWILSLLAAAIVVAIAWFSRRIHSFAWAVMFGLVLGGAVGNLTDRLFRPPSFGMGEVVDFVQLWIFPAIFNIADSGIVIGVCLFVLLSLLGVGLDGKRHRGRPDAAQSVADAVERPEP